MIDWKKIANEWHAEQPHPLNPALKVGEYATAVKLATKLKFGGHASAQEAGAFWGEFQQMNQRFMAQGKEAVSPDEFGHLVERVAPVSFAYHGRPPTMRELSQHRDSSPNEVNKYYGDLPDQHYPHVTAGQMAKYLTMAEPHAQQAFGRPPVKLEAARFALSGLSNEDIRNYYEGAIKGISQLRLPGQPYPTKETGSGGLERRIRDLGPPLSGERRTPTLPPQQPAPPQSGGAETGATE